MPRTKSQTKVKFSAVAVGARLEQLRAETGLTVGAFSDEIGILRSSYYNYRSGQYFPTAETLMMLKKRYNVSADFLLFGDKVNDQGNRRAEKSC